MSKPIEIVEGTDTLRIAWDNRAVRKDRVVLGFFIFFLLVWVPATLFATAEFLVALTEPDPISRASTICFLLVWCPSGWLGTAAVAYSFVVRRWTEWIELTPDVLVVGKAGPLAGRPRTYPLVEVRELALHWYHDGHDHVSMPTINVVTARVIGPQATCTVGYWLAPALKRQVFNAIREFVAARGLPLKVTTYGESPDVTRASP